MNIVGKILLASALVATPSSLLLAAQDKAVAEKSVKVDKIEVISAKDAIKLIGKPGYVFVSGDSPDVYELGHIKGSIEMYAHHLHHSDNGVMHCPPLFMCVNEAEEFIGSKGIKNSDTIIAYDDFRGPNATGVYAFFRSFGHKKVVLLDGGRDAVKSLDPNQKKYDELNEELKKLTAEKADKAKIDVLQKQLKTLEPKLLIQTGHEPKIKPTKYTINPKNIDYSWIAGKDDILEAAMDIAEKGDKSKFVIIDSRGMAEIIGERYLDNVSRAGHVPGATLIEWSNFTDFDKRLSFKDKKEMQAVLDRYGITKDKTVYAYCHVGAGRSSHIITVLKMLGYKDVKVYTGSWDEWGNDLSLPIER